MHSLWDGIIKKITDLNSKVWTGEAANPIESKLGRLQANTLLNHILEDCRATEPNGDVAILSKQLPPSKSEFWKVVPPEVKASLKAAVADIKDVQYLKSGRQGISAHLGAFLLKCSEETEYVTSFNPSCNLRWSVSDPTNSTITVKGAGVRLNAHGPYSFAPPEPELPQIGSTSSVSDIQTPSLRSPSPGPGFPPASPDRAPPTSNRRPSPSNSNSQATLFEPSDHLPEKSGEDASNVDQTPAFHSALNPNPRTEIALNVTGPTRQPKSYSRHVPSRPRKSYASLGQPPYARTSRKARSSKLPRSDDSGTTAPDNSMGSCEAAEFVGFDGSVRSESNIIVNATAVSYTSRKYVPCSASGNDIVEPEASLPQAQSLYSPSREQGHHQFKNTSTTDSSLFLQVSQGDSAQQEAKGHFGDTAMASLDGSGAFSHSSMGYTAETLRAPCSQIFDGACSTTGWDGIPAFEDLESADPVVATKTSDWIPAGDAPTSYSHDFEPQPSGDLPYVPHYPPPSIQASPVPGFYAPAPVGQEDNVINPSTINPSTNTDPPPPPQSDDSFWDSVRDLPGFYDSIPSIISEGSAAALNSSSQSQTPVDGGVDYGPAVSQDELDRLFQQGVDLKLWPDAQGHWNYA